MGKARFMLIREIGAGMWNEIYHVLTQLLVAEIMKGPGRSLGRRQPVCFI